MAVSKCVKCGANIPEGAGFCPACGAPKAAEAAPAPAAPQPVAQPAPVRSGGSGFSGFIKTIFSEMMLVIGFFIAILVAWILRLIGFFYAHIAINIMYLTVMAGLGGFLLCAGFLNKRFNVYVRAALIVSGAAIIATHL